MKHLFRCLFALLCAAALTASAFADVMPGGLVRGSGLGTVLLAGVIAIGLSILYLLLKKRKK